MTVAESFIWGGNTGQKLTPGQAQVMRAMAQERSSRPVAQNFGEGLAALGDALVVNAYNGRANAAETDGQNLVADAMAAEDWMGVMGNEWASPGQRSVGSAMLDRDWQLEDRSAQWAREDQRAAAAAAQAANQPIKPIEVNGQLIHPQTFEVLGDFRTQGGGEATDYGMTPIWGSFADGSMGYGVQGSDGQFHPVDTGNFKPMDPRTLSSERAAGGAYGKGAGLNDLNAPSAAIGLDQMNAKTDHVVDTIDKAIDQLSWDSTGLIGQTMGAFGGTKAYDLRKTAQTIKANLGFAELQAMRDASPTGGALGQVAVQELEALQSTLESLDANQSEDQLRENLGNVKVLLERQKDFRSQAFAAKYGGGGGSEAESGSLPQVANQAEYDSLPSGTAYVAPDGTTRTKP